MKRHCTRIAAFAAASLVACAPDAPLPSGVGPDPADVTLAADVIISLDDATDRILPSIRDRATATALGATIQRARKALAHASVAEASLELEQAHAELDRIARTRPDAVDPAELDAIRLALDIAAEAVPTDALEAR